MAATRNPYRRRQHESKVHDDRDRQADAQPDSYQDVRAACDKWLAQHTAKDVRGEVVTNWHRQHQRKNTMPLGLLLARSEALELRSVGRIQQEKISTEGWEQQVLDGDLQGKLALV
jgi:hypothetical protein